MRRLVEDEGVRRREFGVVGEGLVFMAHGGVAPLPGVAVRAMEEFGRRGGRGAQENEWVEGKVREARRVAGRMIGAGEDEISLIGPTSLGLSLVAAGLDWEEGDEVVYYVDDYPANVYAWKELERRGVKAVGIRTERQGVIGWDEVEGVLTERTKLVSLASCNFVSGYRIDVGGIGSRLHERGILFCVDGIQTVGAFGMDVEQVDFLSADSHKWMLGPAGAGIFYVKREVRERLRPGLVGSWNVVSPRFVAQEEVRFEEGGRRYEPGMLNLPGIVGMGAALEMLEQVGVGAISQRILALRGLLVEAARKAGYELYVDVEGEEEAHGSGIVTLRHGTKNMKEVNGRLMREKVVASVRHNRAGEALLRFSPHFYNTEEEVERVAGLL